LPFLPEQGGETVKKNVGGLDRLFRLSIGFASAAVAYVTDDSALRIVFGIVAAIGLGTALLGYCPMNGMLGRDTSTKKGK
jgi:Inner membrane protein YgaP-like, transmembrane domain